MRETKCLYGHAENRIAYNHVKQKTRVRGPKIGAASDRATVHAWCHSSECRPAERSREVLPFVVVTDRRSTADVIWRGRRTQLASAPVTRGGYAVASQRRVSWQVLTALLDENLLS